MRVLQGRSSSAWAGRARSRGRARRGDDRDLGAPRRCGLPARSSTDNVFGDGAAARRREDIPLLVGHFLAKAGRKLGKSFEGVSPAFLERATSYGWPGNVRELENVVERGAILSRGSLLDATEPFGAAAALPRPEVPAQAPAAGTLEDVERGPAARCSRSCAG